MSDAEDALIGSLLAAIERSPSDVPLRLHVAGLLLGRGEAVAALGHCAAALQVDPHNREAVRLLEGVVGTLRGGAPGDTPPDVGATSAPTERAAPESDGFDWSAAERQLGDLDAGALHPGAGPPAAVPASPGRSPITLDAVGGMDAVKRELRESFLVPMANPELRAAYGSSLRGGLLLYGPPGCGKSYIGRALAGELGASFFSFSLADLLDSMFGQSERNVRDIFDVARAHRPSVIFFDEVDAIGQKRSNLRSSPMMRGTVNQLLSEMDGAQADNEGVFVLGASNQPWDVDAALRRPGRFDRTLFVPPPDAPARAAILDLQLAGRPVADIDGAGLAKATADFSGADLARLCDVATRRALAESARTNEVRPIRTKDLKDAMAEVRPTTREWLTTARNVVRFANEDGTYDELAAYLKANRL